MKGLGFFLFFCLSFYLVMDKYLYQYYASMRRRAEMQGRLSNSQGTLLLFLLTQYNNVFFTSFVCLLYVFRTSYKHLLTSCTSFVSLLNIFLCLFMSYEHFCIFTVHLLFVLCLSFVKLFYFFVHHLLYVFCTPFLFFFVFFYPVKIGLSCGIKFSFPKNRR